MISWIRRARTTSRALAFALVLVMSMSFARPSQGMLTEIVVGVELGMSALSLLAQALPQITLVAANILTLVQTGQTIADTIKRIGQSFGGHHDEGGQQPPAGGAPGTPPTTGDLAEIPTIPMDSAAKGSEIGASAPAAIENPVLEAIALVVDTFRKRLDLYGKLSKLPDGPTGKDQFADAYSSLLNHNEQAVASTATLILDAVREGDQATIDKFVAAVEKLDGASRPALIPVLNRVIEQGRTFSLLNGEGEGLFPKLVSLHTKLTK